MKAANFNKAHSLNLSDKVDTHCRKDSSDRLLCRDCRWTLDTVGVHCDHGEVPHALFQGVELVRGLIRIGNEYAVVEILGIAPVTDAVTGEVVERRAVYLGIRPAPLERRHGHATTDHLDG